MAARPRGDEADVSESWAERVLALESEVARLRARVEALESALRPFAEVQFKYDTGRSGFLDGPKHEDFQRALATMRAR